MTRKPLGWLIERPIAHRGLHDLSRGVPENSLAAFEAACAAGYAIECDLHPSTDGVPMVFHDDDLDRLTDAEGSLRDRTAAELGQLALARTGERIPRLDELLELARGRVPLVIELKHVPGRDAGFAAVVVDRLKNYNGPAALMSFDAGLIADIQASGPEIPRGLTAAGSWQDGGKHLKTISQLQVDFVSYAVDDLPTPAPLFARRVLGIPLISWTIRTPEQYRKARIWTDQVTFEGFNP
jgi:glycerophosphoryl diester phosphodiesterase